MCNCFRSNGCSSSRFDRCVNNAVRAAEAAACRAARDAKRAQENACRANESAERATCEARVAEEAACRAQNCRNSFVNSFSQCGCNNSCADYISNGGSCGCGCNEAVESSNCCNECISYRDFNRMFCC